MILGAKDWIGNFAMDTLNRIFINILDNMVYMLIGFAYKVYLMIASIDLFNNYNTGTENVHEIYTELTSRIYSVLAIIVMFVLAYQIIIFIIDPDKGMKQSKQLIVNLVKAIIMVVLAPLVFHYMAQIQYHVLISDNVIWRLVLGEGGSQSSNVTEGGNTMASMVFMSLYHPVGTQYSDFYDNDGTLKSYDDACAFYKGGNMSKDTLAKVIRGGTGGAGVGAAIGAAGFLGFGALPGAVAGGIAGAGTALITSLLEEDTTACQFYYRQLYIGDGKVNGSDFNIKPNEINTVTDYSDRNVGSSNKTLVLASVPALADEVYQEGNMEYYYFSSVAGALILYLLVAYVLDIAYRAFKLAFLQMVAPVPILLGVIPKNEKIYSQWKDSFIKTYLDIFVRVFVMAFVILMIKLLPSFVGAMYTVLSAGGDTEASGILKAVTMVAMIIGLLRFGKELPEMIKDVAKNGPGLLSGIDLNPNNSFKKTKEGIEFGKDVIGRPTGAIAGGLLGAWSARNSIGGKKASRFDRTLASLRGLQTGGKMGFQNGLRKGSMTAAMIRSNDIASNDLNERTKRVEAFKQGKFGVMIDELTQGRVNAFTSALKGNTIGLDSSFLYKAGQAYQENAAGVKKFYSKAGDGAKAKLNPQYEHAMNTAVIDENKFGYTDTKDSSVCYIGTTLEEVRNDALSKSEIRDENNQITGYKFNGKEYSTYDEINAAINSSITAESMKNIVRTEFRGQLYENTYDGLQNQLFDVKSELIKQAEVKEFKGSLDIDNIKKIADSASVTDAHYYDSIGPELQKKISDKSSKAFEQVLSDEFKQMLIDANGGKTIDPSDARSVMSVIKGDKFINKYSSLDGDALDKIKGDLAYYLHEVNEGEAKVGNEIDKKKSGANGARINEATGLIENSLTGKRKEQ